MFLDMEKYIYSNSLLNALYIEIKYKYKCQNFPSEKIDVAKKHPLKEHRCKFKIDKIACSKSWCRITYCITKNKPSMYP